MSLYASIESLAFGLHRAGYSSNDYRKIKSFVTSHRVDLLPLFFEDGNFDSTHFLNAIDEVALAGNALDSSKAFMTLAHQIQCADDQLADRIVQAIDDIEAYEQVQEQEAA